MTHVHGVSRRALWLAGAPARALLVGLIRLYRLTLSASLGGQCRFYPSCSRFAENAITLHGAVKGTAIALWRIARCGPFTAGGVDHVRMPNRAPYDTVVPGAADR